jgi:hypothetical protein
MMNKIQRYPIPGNGAVSMPAGARLMKLDWYHGRANVWASGDPLAPLRAVVFRAFTDGDEPPENLIYVTTLVLNDMEGEVNIQHWYVSAYTHMS